MVLLMLLLCRMKRDDPGFPPSRERSGTGLTAHGFRSIFSDWAAERTAYPREGVEMALAHAVANRVETAYRRGDLFEKRCKSMEAWASFCEAPPAVGLREPLVRGLDPRRGSAAAGWRIRSA
jgi:hypothetical protein